MALYALISAVWHMEVTRCAVTIDILGRFVKDKPDVLSAAW